MISNYTQLLKKRYGGKLDKDADEFIDYANNGAKHLQQLLRDFQTLSTLLVGVLLVVMVCLAPEGLVGAFNRLWDMRTGVRPASRTDVDESTELRERSLPI